METKDLKQVKYIGASRLKSLKGLGINTIEQLHETPIDNLAQIPTIGRHYAKLIKAAASQAYGEKSEKTDREGVFDEEKKLAGIREVSSKQLEVLIKHLKRLNADLKPPEKKKKLELFNDLKKRSAALINRLDGLGQKQGDLPKKIAKNITKKAEALNAKLKNAGEKIKKKKIQKLALEIQSFSKMLKKTVS